MKPHAAPRAQRPSTAELRRLLRAPRPPCVSLYMPLHGTPAEAAADALRYRKLLRQAERALRLRWSLTELRPVLAQFAALLEEGGGWNGGLTRLGGAGLAAFASRDGSRVFRLAQAPQELVYVGEHFHLKPLLRVLQSEERYQVLTLTLERAQLYEGTRETLDVLDMSPVPASLTDALGTELTEPYLKVTRSYGGGAAGPAPMFHGQHDRKEERNLDRERFFRIIDHGIHEHFSKRSRLPLVLVGLAENAAHFRLLSRNPLLLAEGVAVDPGALTAEQLHEATWRVVAPHFDSRVRRLVSEYQEARAHGRGSDRAEEVAAALAEGRVGTLLVEADRRIPGRLDPVRGRISLDPGAASGGSAAAAAEEDVLDDLAEAVLRTRGEVVIAPREQMPTDRGLAAIYRF